ncbi:aminopeptidase N-like [Lutzomyia longipalpis]|uniref:aminopeptidase N-like n=1 Tax=Lutzomyia longipalpis TaxID=7200 RepID=UPI002483BC01|nr:aminopeptidase N-like [Lutzomyia longipalpis]
MLVKRFFFSLAIIAPIVVGFQPELNDLAENPNTESGVQVSSRLTNTTEPVAYELWLRTNIHRRILDYDGRVKCVLRALEATKYITINSELIQIENFTMVDHLNNPVKISNMFEYKNERVVVFQVDNDLRIGQNYILEIFFSGVLHNYPRGFCYARYTDEYGRVVYIASSHMHVTNARMAFPCYDEPRYRTPFIIHLVHHSSMTAASNMPIAFVTDLPNNFVISTFEETVPMSTNLLAFSVSNYVTRTETIESKRLNVSILVPRHLKDEVDFALEFFITMLEELENFFGVGYTLPKFDAIIVPDFLYTAMENWGLMTFDPKYLLFKRDHTSPSQMVEVAKSICHHLIHNYFGNLVGLDWWSDAWMTEGFSNYYQNYFTQFYLKDYPLEEFFVVDYLQRSFVEDSLIIAPPLSEYVETQHQIETLYEFATTGKASSILRMCDYFLGKETFRKGLQYYIKDMAFQVAQPKDLYRNLQLAADEDNALPEDIKIENIFKTWIEQPGYPLLTVMRNYQSNEIVVNQHRFLSARDEEDVRRDSWYIPLSISTAKNPNMNNTRPWAWLRGGTREIVLQTKENLTWTSDDWVLFNVQQTGYYRVNYDPINWKLLAEELHRGSPYKIGTLNRAQLIDDVFNLAYSDVVSFTMALDIIKYIRYDEDYIVWVTANRHLLNMARKLDGPSYELFFGRFLQHLTNEHFERMDVFPHTRGRDTPRITFFRPIIVDLACRAKLGTCLTATRIQVTAEALTGTCLVPMEQAATYYCHGLKNADQKTFQYFWKKLNNMTSEHERMQLTYAITCYHDPDVVYSVLVRLADPITDLSYTNLERYHLLATALRNGHLKVVLKFLKNNYENIEKLFNFNIRMEHALKEIAWYIQEEDIPEYEEILKLYFSNGYISENLIKRLRIDIEYHLGWIRENKVKIENWIRDYFEPMPAKSACIHTSISLVFFIIISLLF